jgi:hypothetical protein
MTIVLGISGAIAQIVPTTTLAAETGNNTSAANTFKTSTNGNTGSTNVSKVSIKKLLYPGFSGKAYVHVQPWFGQASHINIGYSSSDPAQVARQVTDMMSRGFDGAIVDWYGPNKTFDNSSTLAMKAEADKRGGKFQFAIAEDVGALKACQNTPGCNLTDRLIADLKYAYTNLMSSPNYIRQNGRPVVFLFGLESLPGIDWSRASATLTWKPIFIWRNSGGFNKPSSGGSFAWVTPTNSTTNWNESYLNNFYSTAMNFPTQVGVANGYKGFNDGMASWGSHRTLPQLCGQTWLNSMAKISQYYSTNRQNWGVQVSTWNDYEEGTEIESGIDNCLNISASMNGSTLNWSISGQENTLDHFTIFASTDGVNLAALGDVAITARSVNLANYALPAGSYKYYVKAVGKASIINHMSNAVGSGSTGAQTQPPPATVVSYGIAVQAPTVLKSAASTAVRFVASATSGATVTAMRIYVDNVSRFAVNAAKLDTSMQLAAGTRNVTIQAWDATGKIYKNSFTMTMY